MRGEAEFTGLRLRHALRLQTQAGCEGFARALNYSAERQGDRMCQITVEQTTRAHGVPAARPREQ